MIELTVLNVSAMWHKEHSADHIYLFCILGMGTFVVTRQFIYLFIYLFVHRFSTFVMHVRFARNVHVSWNFPHVIGSAAQVSWQLYGAIAEYPATPTWRVGILCIIGWKTTGTIVIQWDANKLWGILQPNHRVWKGGGGPDPAFSLLFTRIPHPALFHRYPESRFSFPKNTLKMTNFCKS